MLVDCHEPNKKIGRAIFSFFSCVVHAISLFFCCTKGGRLLIGKHAAFPNATRKTWKTLPSLQVARVDQWGGHKEQRWPRTIVCCRHVLFFFRITNRLSRSSIRVAGSIILFLSSRLLFFLLPFASAFPPFHPLLQSPVFIMAAFFPKWVYVLCQQR
jgi:hypothetical protein